jgi:ABC-2 type transport system permease protein
MRQVVRVLLATSRTALVEAFANRAGFWTQVGAMMANDVAWVVFWFLFFNRVGDVRGWDRSLVLLLFAVLTTAAGLVLGLLGNARVLGQLASEGGFDAALALPVPTLAYVLVRRVETANMGDALFGVLLFGLSGTPTPGRVALYLVGSLAGACVFLGFLVLTGSLSFFTGSREIGDLGLNAILLLSSYPAEIFTGYSKALLYTAVPAAFVAGVPAQLIADFDVRSALVLVVAAATSLGLGVAVFNAGLRRYTSGAVWTKA